MDCLQDPEKFKSRMHSLAYGNAMMAAARDYQQVLALPALHSLPGPALLFVAGFMIQICLTA